MLIVLPLALELLAAGLVEMTKPAACWSLFSSVTVPIVKPAASSSALAVASSLPTTFGTWTTSFMAMIILTLLPSRLEVLAAGSVRRTVPSSTSDEASSVMVPTTSPADSILAEATSTVCPFTSGTSTVSGVLRKIAIKAAKISRIAPIKTL